MVRRGRQSSDLLLAGAATSIVFVATNTCLSQHKTSFVATKVLFVVVVVVVVVVVTSLQKYACCNISRQIFVATKVLWRQKYLVATNMILSRQAYFCRDKTRVPFVATNTCLSRQTFCRHKNDTCGSTRQLQ